MRPPGHDDPLDPTTIGFHRAEELQPDDEPEKVRVLWFRVALVAGALVGALLLGLSLL